MSLPTKKNESDGKAESKNESDRQLAIGVSGEEVAWCARTGQEGSVVLEEGVGLAVRAATAHHLLLPQSLLCLKQKPMERSQ